MLNELPSAEISARATDAFRFGYAMVESYRTMYAQAIDATDPRFLGGFGVYRHYREPSTPESRDVITPNNDTPYSWIWLDLRAEPVVVTVPEIDRYYANPLPEPEPDLALLDRRSDRRPRVRRRRKPDARIYPFRAH